jgi:hypothetical protein
LNAYADTSFLVSLYGSDPHSPAALAEVRTNKPAFILTSLAELEFSNAVELRVFQKGWKPIEARRVLEESVEDMRSGTLRIEALPDEVCPSIHAG